MSLAVKKVFVPTIVKPTSRQLRTVQARRVAESMAAMAPAKAKLKLVRQIMDLSGDVHDPEVYQMYLFRKLSMPALREKLRDLRKDV